MKKLLIRICLSSLILSVALHTNALTVKQFKSDKLTSNLVTCIIQDKKGYIWIGTEHGLNKFDGYVFTNYLHSEKDTSSIIDNSIVTMYIDSHGNFLIGTNSGLCRYNYKNNCFENYSTKGGERPRISSIIELNKNRLIAGSQGYGIYNINNNSEKLNIFKIQSGDKTASYCTFLYQDRYNNLWKGSNDNIIIRYIGNLKGKTKCRRYVSPFGNPVRFISDHNHDMLIVCQHGLLIYDHIADKLVPANLSQKIMRTLFINSAFTDHNGNIFLGTIGNGVFLWPYQSKIYQRYNIQNIDFSLNNGDIRFIYEDRQKNIWIGCSNKGILFVPNEKTQFCSWSFAAQNYHIGNAISSMVLGDNNSIWCTVTNDGAYQFDKTGKICSHVKAPPGTDIIYRDRKGNYWIGAYDKLYSYSPTSETWKLSAKLSGYMIRKMIDNGKGKLYISTFSKGLTVYDCLTKHIKNYNMYQCDKLKGNLCNDWITNMYFDSNGLLWIGTVAGVSCFSPNNESFRTYGWMNTLTQTTCYGFCEDTNDNIIIGTNKGLFIFNKKNHKVIPFPGADILSNQTICSCHYANNGDFWFSTSMGIWQYRHQTHKFVSYINGNGLNAREYLSGLGLDGTDGRIYVANSEGLTTFYPNKIGNTNRYIGKPILTYMLIGEKPINCTTLSNGDYVTKKPVDESDRFKISYLDNTFTMEFSVLDYSNSDNIFYEYRLNGSDNWSQTEDGKNSILFSHLLPGSYFLEVRACNGDYRSGIKTYYITIAPPWYNSSYAYLCYILIILVLIIYGFYRYRRHKHEELYEEKMQFLMNTTHDIRSPLTLIMGPLKKIMNKEFDNETKGELDIINHNAQRILKLVNQILDIRKFDKNLMTLHCQDTNLIEYIENLCHNFDFIAKEYNVKFTFEHHEEKIHAWIDRINFDKVISNLLSNAFKYVNDDGEIKVVLKTGTDMKSKGELKNYVEIQVIDSGIGLSETKTEKIFDRFYQGKNSVNTGTQGTGIGLNLCKMIVEMHHGSIIANNRTDATGTCFTVRIPLGKEHLKTEEIIDETNANNTIIRMQGTQFFRILVVDDDVDICKYISTELSIFYRFTLCNNGKEALKELLRNKYDLVVSDVIMPVMNGFELVKSIKNNTNISHIPVILLTSRSDIGNRLEGISKGADAYIAKPFDIEELHVTINNLIKNMQRLHGKFSGALRQEKRVEEKKVDGNNDLLMERIMKSVNENLSDSDFDVEQLASDIGISRAHLHRKMKEMTGVSAGEFLRNLRLEQAARLICEKRINITQVAYTVGFTSEAHLSTLFKKHFGLSPSEYIKRYNDNNK
jgi:signal transduction histidine kinase/ligand-binding sensor domain-containing protein/DNA-binding response OmpR family regulator